MSHRSDSVGSRPYYPSAGSNPYDKPNLQKVAGVALMLIGGIYSLYGAGSGISTLVRVSLDHFGLLCLAGTANFIFWTVIVFPIGGIVANTICMTGGVLLFGGLPATPGALVVGAGAFVYFSA